MFDHKRDACCISLYNLLINNHYNYQLINYGNLLQLYLLQADEPKLGVLIHYFLPIMGVKLNLGNTFECASRGFSLQIHSSGKYALSVLS